MKSVARTHGLIVNREIDERKEKMTKKEKAEGDDRTFDNKQEVEAEEDRLKEESS